MRAAIRGYLSLTVFLWLIAAHPATADPGNGGGPPDPGNGHGNGGNGNYLGGGGDDGDQGGGSAIPCGQAPGDADQIAAVRAAADANCDCAGAHNHGRYVSCVSHAVNAAVHSGSLRDACRDAVVGCAAKSACGKQGFVTCCRTGANGTTHCSIKRSEAACRAPQGGTACVGSVASCCDACGASGTCPPPGSTTTTVPSATTTSTAPASTTSTTTGATTSTTAGATTSTTAGATTSTTTAATTSTTAAVTTSTSAATTTTIAGATTSTTAAPTTTTAAPTTTTVVVTTSTAAPTTTTSPGPVSLKFTNAPGTTNCGGPGLSPVPSSPFTGELDSDAACSTKTNDLGRGCLYIGGGNAKAIPPGAVPSGATNYLDVSGSNLVASNGTGTLDCTKAAGPGKVCLNNDTLNSCTSDANCGGFTNGCHEAANCFFGPPLEFPNPLLSSLTTCVLNVVQSDASGTGDPSTGNSSVSLPLASEVYVTGNLGSPCPHCSGTCTYGANVGGACTSGGSTGSSQDCPPTRGGGAFQAPLSVTLSPLTTGTTTLVSATGSFCPNQKTPGAFGVSAVQCVQTAGTAAGDLTDGLPHAGAIIASAFCIPTTTNSTIDGVADLPGPGLTSLPGTAQIVPTP